MGYAERSYLTHEFGSIEHFLDFCRTHPVA